MQYYISLIRECFCVWRASKSEKISLKHKPNNFFVQQSHIAAVKLANTDYCLALQCPV